MHPDSVLGLKKKEDRLRPVLFLKIMLFMSVFGGTQQRGFLLL